MTHSTNAKGAGFTFLIYIAAGLLAICLLTLRGRLVPVALAWLVVPASLLLVIYLPLQMAEFLSLSSYMWLPMLAFEVPLALWLIVKGVASGSRL